MFKLMVAVNSYREIRPEDVPLGSTWLHYWSLPLDVREPHGNWLNLFVIPTDEFSSSAFHLFEGHGVYATTQVCCLEV